MLDKINQKILKNILNFLDEGSWYSFSMANSGFKTKISECLIEIKFERLLKHYQIFSPEKLVDLLLNNINHSRIRDSLLVRMLDTEQDSNAVRLDYRGLFVMDDLTTQALTGQSRMGVNIYPFPAPKVASMMVYHAKVGDEIFIVLIKSKRRNDGYTIPGGNLSVIHPKGAEKGVARISDNLRDEAEELLLKGDKDAYKKINPNPQSELPLISEHYHNSLKDCAIREGFEETGICLDRETSQQTEMVFQKEYTSVRRRMHLILHYFETFCGSFSSLEALPKLAPIDILEVESAEWVSTREILYHVESPGFTGVNFTLSYNSILISPPQLEGLNRVLRFVRDKDIQSLSANVYAGIDNLLSAQKTILGNIIPKPSEIEFGNDAHEYHSEICRWIINANKKAIDCGAGLLHFSIFAVASIGACVAANYFSSKCKL